jgi:alkanesulfonate monooxygenase SsuD/methylene tetrahydromethanopterin reductase-like flavin-dependent oxidoreductase (luciferase family)
MQLSDLRVFTGPRQGATYDDLLAVAVRAERLGFGALFRSDHYLAMGAQGRLAISVAGVDHHLDLIADQVAPQP